MARWGPTGWWAPGLVAYDWLRAPSAMSLWMSTSRKTPPNVMETPRDVHTIGGSPRVMPDCAPNTEKEARDTDSMANIAPRT